MARISRDIAMQRLQQANVPESTISSLAQQYPGANVGAGGLNRAIAMFAQPASAVTPSAGQSLAETYQNFMQYSPQIAREMFGVQQELLPQQAQLAFDLQSQYGPLQQQLRFDERAADIANIASLTPQLRDIQAQTEGPNATAIRSLLGQQLLGELQEGVQLTPEQARQAQQATRTAQFARGLGQGPGSANREAVKQALEGRRLQSERQAKASAFLRQQAQESIDPFLAIGGRPSTPLAFAGQGESPFVQGTGLMNLSNQLRAQEFGMNQNALQFELARANALRSPSSGSTGGGTSGILGGALGGAALGSGFGLPGIAAGGVAGGLLGAFS